MRLFITFLVAAALLTGIPAAVAQSVGAIEIGGTVQGAVTAEDPAPSYFFETAGPASLLARVQVSPDALTPVLLAADSANRVISTMSASPGMRVLESQFTVAANGRYFVQVQGLNGSQGIFSLTLIDVNAVTPTPTFAPPTATPPPPPSQTLSLGQSITSEVSAAASGQRFTIAGAASGLVIRIDSPSRGAPGFPAFTLLDGSGFAVATLTGGLRGGTLVLPPAQGVTYTLVAAHSGGEAQPFRVALLDALTYLVLESEALARLNAPLPTPPPAATQSPVDSAPTAAPVQPPPSDVDLLLRWDGAALTMTNVSGAPVDISAVSMSGNNRTVDSSYWARSNPALNLAALPAGSCVGLRPLAYPDAPPLPPGCNDLGAWWSADIVYVWGSETFDVYLNGALAATCTSSAGQCAVDVAGN
ncbi:MAG TPA: hypothetical protein VER79_04215 [Candidatus Limnocylindrales bacterium]|nr:hypothetical protein [Candidatus Limnocylindrales bacterium]